MKKLSRRNVVVGSLVAAGGTAAVVNLPPVHRSLCYDVLASREQIAAIGAVCVACNPDLTSANVAAKWAALGAPRGEDLDRRIKDDFADGAMASVQGWMLSNVEILAYAARHYGIA